MIEVSYILIGILCFWYYAHISLKYGCINPIRWLKGVMTNKEFDEMLDKIFADPDISFNEYTLEGAGHEIWCVNRYLFFKVDGRRGFSFMQMQRFYGRLDRWLANIAWKHTLGASLKKRMNVRVAHIDKISEETEEFIATEKYDGIRFVYPYLTKKE